MPDDALPLLNVYEVTAEGGKTLHLLTFLQADRAADSGIEPRSIVGEVTPTDSGGFDPLSLKLNPEFIEAFAAYMNEVVAGTSPIVEQARSHAPGWVYVVDPRNRDEPGAPMPATDLMGTFAVDEAGNVVPDSFDYNANHALIDTDRGMSGLFSDRRFYDWLHPADGPA